MAVERFPVEAGHIMMFARAIGDTNACYYAAISGGEGLAPPTFVWSSAHFDPDCPVRPRIGQPWLGSGRQPSGLTPAERAGSGGLHAEQHYRYHRAVRQGDVLTSVDRPGRTWEKEGRRGGKLVFSETITDYRDRDGEMVVTATMVVVRTEQVVTSEPVNR